ncbi:MAG: hypothetical protein J6J31_10005 [Thermoguttaceae bacterium]|nr:hypothetical protein [Thermoguttaceae bacterium]
MKKCLALKLLFQFRIPIDGNDGTFRRCEERYIMLEIQENETVDQLIDRFYASAKKENFSYKNINGDSVFLEFVGVLDYILWDYDPQNEFWYDYTTRKLPMERKKELTLSKTELKRRIAAGESAGTQHVMRPGRRFELNNLTFHTNEI